MTQDFRIAVEASRPCAVCHERGQGSAGLIILGSEIAPEHRLITKHFQKIMINRGNGYPLSARFSHEVDHGGTINRQCRKGRLHPFPIDEVGIGYRCTSVGLDMTLLYVYELSRLWIWQRT